MSTVPKYRPWSSLCKLGVAGVVLLICCVIAVQWSHLIGGLSLAVALISWLLPLPWSDTSGETSECGPAERG